MARRTNPHERPLPWSAPLLLSPVATYSSGAWLGCSLDVATRFQLLGHLLFRSLCAVGVQDGWGAGKHDPHRGMGCFQPCRQWACVVRIPRLVSVRAGEVSIGFRHSFTDEDSPRGHLRCGRPRLSSLVSLTPEPALTAVPFP